MLNKLKRAALGAHTPHDKATAASKPVPMPLPAQVRILMSQHIGAPAKALVKKGDEVFVGTKIGEAGGFVSANIHSSVSGTVAAVEPFRLSNGRMCDSVVIKTDGKQTVDPAVKAPEVTDKASFLAAVRECGLVGLGGAGFPTDVKLQPKLFSSLSGSWLLLKPRPAVDWSLLPALEVMQMTVLEKSTVRPWASLILPSSRI